MPISFSRRRALQWSALLPLSACTSTSWYALEGRHATLSPDGQRLQLIIELAREQRVYSYPRDWTEVLSRQILFLDLPAQPDVHETHALLKKGRLLAGPDPQRARGRFSAQLGHVLLAQDDLRWCRFEPEGGLTTLGRIERPSANEAGGEARWVLGDEGRFVLTPDLMVDVTQPQPLLQGWSSRPGYRSFASALQEKEPLASRRRTLEGMEYELRLVEGRWLLAMLPLRQSGVRMWAYSYDLLEDSMSAWMQDSHAARCRNFVLQQAARLGPRWMLWLRSSALYLGGMECGPATTRDAVLDRGIGELFYLTEDAPTRLNKAMAKVWDPARRRIVVLEDDDPEPRLFELPTRVRVDELRY